ncbi:RimK-like ATP-grasp domain protein [compost metagenome]
MPPLILVISSLAEPCTDYVIDEISALGGGVIRINYEEAVTDSKWAVELSNTIKNPNVSISNSLVNLLNADEPDAIWMRRWGYPALPKSFDEQSKAFAFNEISSLISGLPSVLNKKWINHPYRERISSNKILQLEMARKCGWHIPNTIITNDALAVSRFKNAIGRVIFKPVSAVQSPFRRHNPIAQKKMNLRWPDMDFGIEADDSLIFTQELTEEKIEFLDSLKWSPAIFQERIDKVADIRVTVIGTTIFACRIDSQSRDETATDFRYMNIIGALPHELIELNGRMKEQILEFMKNLGLTFGCLDFLENKNGEYIFLEINPSGQWLWIEQLTGAPISKALAIELMNLS